MRAVMEVVLSASKGAAMKSPLALISMSMGCTMHAVPHPKISRSLPSFEACQQPEHCWQFMTILCDADHQRPMQLGTAILSLQQILHPHPCIVTK